MIEEASLRILNLIALLMVVAAQLSWTPSAGAQQAAGWPTYGNTPGGSRYSPLDEINPSNVADLEIAWSYRTGDDPKQRPELKKTA